MLNSFNFFFFNILNLNFIFEVFFFQIIFVYLLYLLYNQNNVYYTFLYFFLIFIYLGLFISFIQFELFTGFLWVVEGTVVFIFMLLLFFLNVEGNYFKISLNYYKYIYIFILFLIFLFFFKNLSLSLIEETVIFLNFIDLWDDYYEALNNKNMNDFLLLFISYYSINSIEFILLGILLLIGSIICVNLNKIQKSSKLNKLDHFFTVFNKYKDFYNYSFLRKQNLTNQANSLVSLRVYKKKI